MREQFIGRRQELEALENAYRADGFQMAVLYGRRRVGKSTLLEKFSSGKKALFYTAVKTTPRRNLELLGKRALRLFAPDMQGISFGSYDDLFHYLTVFCEKERVIFIIDEFPYIAEQDKSLTSVLQKYIDTEWKSGNMFLILSGSSISFMESSVMGEKSPLHGRRTMQIRLEPFDYLDSAEFLPEASFRDKAILYGVTGGIAKYLSLFDERKSIDDNIVSLFFSKTGYLFEEPNNLLMQEFRNVSIYSAIVEAIANGANKLNEIAEKTHIERTSVSHALDNLTATGIIRRERPVTEEKNTRKSQYRLLDTMFRFWYRFVPDAMDLIEAGYGEKYYQSVVQPLMNEYMGRIFETICRHYTLLAGVSGKLPVFVTGAGSWWGSDPEEKEEVDIDVVGISRVSKEAVIGECKFKNVPVGMNVLKTLQRRGRLISGKYTIVQYLLFSLSGFSDELRRMTDIPSVKLVTMDDLYDNDLKE